MSTASGLAALAIGWDVGGWNCERNRLSRDALVVVDAALRIQGRPWRGSLRELINDAQDTGAFVQGLLRLCGIDEALATSAKVVLGIDTPLGHSAEFLALWTQGKAVERVQGSASNPYLFRYTERYLFERGLTPLSSVKDMIGSQATKGMHVLARFIPQRMSCGVWQQGGAVTAIEAYPSAAKKSATMDTLRHQCLEGSAITSDTWHDDERDALTAALLAWLFQHRPEQLAWPSAEAPLEEGWIFVPEDALAWRG